MSSAGQTFSEKIFVISESTAGSKQLNVDVENDGCIIFIQRTSGVANITGSITTDGRDSTPEVVLESISISDGDVDAFAVLSMRNLKIDLTWDGACDITVLVQLKSGSAISEWNANQDTTNDSISIGQLTVGTGGVQIVNVSGRKTIGIRNWSDPLTATNILFVGDSALTGTNGWPLAAREGISIDVDSGASLYLTTDVDTVDARTIQVKRS